MMAEVHGRYAPSPSGRMHMGNALSALLAWCSARSQGGMFSVRLEDLDRRCRDEQVAQVLLDDLRWLGIDWDGEVLRQSDRNEAYEHAFERLVLRGLIYPCFCSRADLHAASAPHLSDGTPLYAGTCRELDVHERAVRERELFKRTGHGPAWRVCVCDKTYSFFDGLYGFMSQNLQDECGDFVVRRSDGVYAYQLAVVVDDAYGAVTEVVRGNDLLASVARQMYLQDALSLPTPMWRHHPMLLAADGRRLSKRDRDLDLGVLRARLDSPQRLVGFLAECVGLTERGAVLSATELAAQFDWSRVSKEDVFLDETALRSLTV